MSTPEATSTSSWVKKIWPVKRSELKKIVPLLLLKFFVSIVYTMLTCMKDPLIITAPHAGAEVIPVIKAWVVFPLSILCVIIYSKLSNQIKRSTLFYSIISFFLAFMVIYGFVLYPHADFFCPTKSADKLAQFLGARHSHWVAIYRNWIHTLFFAFSELWAQVVILTLYWGFANHICRIKEAKRTYILFTAAGDIGTILGPLLIKYYTRGHFVLTVQAVAYYVLVFGALILLTYWWMQRHVLTDSRYYNPKTTHHSVNEKTKLSLFKSIKHILSSKYLLAIASTVIFIALTMNIVEVTWKAYVKQQYPNINACQIFYANQTFAVGIVAFITAFMGSGLLRRFGWLFSARIAPIAICTTSCIFFLLCIFKDHLSPLATFFGVTPLFLIVIFGAFQAITNKVTKYSFFDSTKEIVYIPLDQESKVKGKAAIEMVGSRFGKSSSSWIQLIVIEIIGTGSILLSSPYLLPIMIGVTICWLRSIGYLNREFLAKEKALTEKDYEEKPQLEPSLIKGAKETPA